jgi:hypothetical protein
MLSKNLKQASRENTDAKEPHEVAVDELAQWIVGECDDANALNRVKEIARRFSFELSNAIGACSKRTS